MEAPVGAGEVSEAARPSALARARVSGVITLLLSAALTSAWLLAAWFGARPPGAYWLCIPVLLLAGRFGILGAAVAVPAAMLVTAAGPQPVRGAGALSTAAFLLPVGVLVALLMRDVREADRAVVSALNRERDLAVGAAAERDALSERLSYEATHDTLTGLPNRSCFLEQLEQALRDRRPGQSVGVLFVDLDDFKTVNDSLGHAAGDELLVGVAGRLRNALRTGDLIARFGGDEFAVLLHDGGGDRALGMVNRLLGVLRAPFALSEGMASGGASGGLVTTAVGGVDDVGEQAADLLRRADLAMYAAKAAGGGGCVEFRDELQHAMLERLALQDDLTEAMIREDFTLQYQPVIELDTQRLVAVEALLRWHHAERGDVPPDVFIPIAEKSGAIVQIGLWVLEQACSDLQRWDELHPNNQLNVAVNLSARQLQDPSVGPQIARVLHRMGVNPSRLILEVTESLVMDDGEAAAATLWQLRALGIRIAVDDFGTGYSSLSRLVDLPLDDIKIDRSFIQELDISEAGATIVSAAIAMAHGLGLNVVAEGIETTEQLAFLLNSGCNQGQGYLFSRPVPAASIGALLHDGPCLLSGASAGDIDQDRGNEGLRPTRPSPTIIPVMPRHR